MIQQGSLFFNHGIIAAMFLLTTNFVPGPSCANALPTAVSSTYNKTTDMSNDNTSTLPGVFTAVSTTYNNTTETDMSTDNTSKTENRRSRNNGGISCEPNDWDEDQYCLCDKDQRISVFKSKHDSRKEDRIWNLKCEPLPFSFDSTNWYTEQPPNAYDGIQHWNGIGTDSFLVGMKSHHDSHKEDRQYTLFTAKSEKWVLSDCSTWIKLNHWDDPINYVLGEKEVIAEVHSQHNNHHEDRIFHIKKCQLITKCTKLKEMKYDYKNAKYSEKKGLFACTAAMHNSGNTASSTFFCDVSTTTAKSLEESYTFSRTSGFEVGYSLDITVGYKWGPDVSQGSVSATAGFSAKWSTSNTWSRSNSETITDSSTHRIRYTGTCAAGCDCTLEATFTQAKAEIPYTLTSETPETGEICTERGTLKVDRTMDGVATMKSNCKETSCTDTYGWCYSQAEYCDHYAFLETYCPKTCKMC